MMKDIHEEPDRNRDGHMVDKIHPLWLVEYSPTPYLELPVDLA